MPAVGRKLPRIENNMKIEASISIWRIDEEVKIHGTKIQKQWWLN
jgi:hypothetical protein